MDFTITKSLRRVLFPESQLVEEGTKQVNNMVQSLRQATTIMNRETARIKQPDILHNLVRSMQDTGKRP